MFLSRWRTFWSQMGRFPFKEKRHPQIGNNHLLMVLASVSLVYTICSARMLHWALSLMKTLSLSLSAIFLSLSLPLPLSGVSLQCWVLSTGWLWAERSSRASEGPPQRTRRSSRQQCSVSRYWSTNTVLFHITAFPLTCSYCNPPYRLLTLYHLEMSLKEN